MTLRNIPLKATIVTEKREAEDLAQIVRSHGFFCEIALAEKCNTRIRKPGKHVSIGCLLLMTKPFGLFIWTVLQDPYGLLILYTLLRWPSIFYTQVLYHMCWKSKMQHSCVVCLFITADYSQDYSYKSVSTNSIRIEL